MVAVYLRNKIILRIRAPDGESLHWVFAQKALNAGLGNKPVGGAGKQEFLAGIGQD
jgi:hypothetical protein